MTARDHASLRRLPPVWGRRRDRRLPHWPAPGPAPSLADGDTGERVGHGEHHRDIRGGTARAAVFGVSDGLVSNMGLILGVAGANPAPSVVRLAGLAGLIAGAISMAAGEYNSMRVQSELLERELAIEAHELRRRPQLETAELSRLYQRRGLAAGQAQQLAEAIMRDPDRALEVHAREELGIDPTQLGSPIGAAVASFLTFSLGAVIPLVAWFFAAGAAALAASLAAGVTTAAIVGVLVASFTDRPLPRPVVRQVLFTVVPAVLTYLVGRAVGVTV